MRKFLLLIFALVMVVCASANVHATPAPNTDKVPTDTTITSDSCTTIANETMATVTFSQQELSSKMMSDNSDKKSISVWKNNVFDWCKEHLFLTGLIGNLFVMLLLWGVYRLIYFFM